MQLNPGNTSTLGGEPRQTGSLRAAAVPGDTTDGTWLHGRITWPEAAASWEITQACTDQTMDYGIDEIAAPVAARPFMVRTLTRGVVTANLDVLLRRAERHIERATGPAIAHELWTGDATALDPWTMPPRTPFELANPRPAGSTGNDGPWLNPHLAPGELLSPAGSPAEAVGRVEQAGAERAPDEPLFLHLPAAWVIELGPSLAHDGDRLRTPLGSIVVADAGYPGHTGPQGPYVAYATGPVQLWLGESVTYSRADQIVRPATNQLGVWSERPALALFDQQTLVGCPVAA